MGILQRLFRTSRQGDQPSRSNAPAGLTILDGDVDLAIVGESFYQDALWHLAGVRRGNPVRCPGVAVLLPEPQNPHDPNAIRIEMEGLQVGHLAAADAVRYGPGLRALMKEYRGRIALRAVIVGGGRGRDNLGVWLSHNPADFGVAPPAAAPNRSRDSQIARRSIRTGFSEAWVTDAEDDSYDLSWHSDLPGDDESAIEMLRRLLAVDPDPIDRHYMFSELESRLYRIGAQNEAAMAEFDVVCRAHHAEMGTIRSAFIAKWDIVPLLNTYRQMSIRHQKSKDWESSRWWAERGIEVYGGKAARAEWVTDLESRRDRAAAKIELLNQPPTPRKSQRSAAEPVDSVASVVEALTCQGCGSEFERVRTRGRKPLMCPSCRG